MTEFPECETAGPCVRDDSSASSHTSGPRGETLFDRMLFVVNVTSNAVTVCGWSVVRSNGVDHHIPLLVFLVYLYRATCNVTSKTQSHVFPTCR